MNYNIRKTAVNLFALRVLTALISFFVLPLSVNYFGISAERDIWILTTAFIQTVTAVFFGPLNEIFRAKFVFLRETEGETEALRKLQSLLLFIVFGILVLSGLVLLFPRQIKVFVAPAVEGGAQTDTFVRLLCLAVPNLLIQQLINIGMSTLNAFNVFYIPEIVGGVSGFINLFCIVLLAPRIGIYALIVSAYIGALMLFGAICFFFHKKRIRVWSRPLRFSWNNVWIFISFALPFYLPYSVGQLGGLLEKSLSNLLGTGIISTIDYSRRFSQILQTVLTTVLTSVMVPSLASAFSKKDGPLFETSFRQAQQIVLIIISLAVSYLVGAAEPVCRFFFLRGDVGPETVKDIIALTRLYALAFIGIAFYSLFGLSILSQQQGKRYALMGMAAQITMIVLNLGFYRFLGIYTFSVTLFLSHTAVGMLMCRALAVENKRAALIELLKYLFLGALLTALLLVLNRFLPAMKALPQMILNAAALFAAFGLALRFVLGIDIAARFRLLLKK
jgi:peptidoglycan biosynthesis protein MviN/MurJ (putative lipid II flippase)